MHKSTLIILELFQKRKSLTLPQLAAILNTSVFNIVENVRYLKKEGYIQYVNLGKEDQYPDSIGISDPYQITLQGRTYLSEYRKNKLNKFWSEFRAWMTLAISLVALIRTFL